MTLLHNSRINVHCQIVAVEPHRPVESALEVQGVEDGGRRTQPNPRCIS